MRIEILWLVFGVFLSSISQVLLKKSADNTNSLSKATSRINEQRNIEENVNKKNTEYSKKSFIQKISFQYLNKYVIAGYLLLLIAMLIPLYALKFVDMKFSAIIEALGYVFIMILSAIFFREKITKKKVYGNIIIIMGVIIFGMSIF